MFGRIGFLKGCLRAGRLVPQWLASAAARASGGRLGGGPGSARRPVVVALVVALAGGVVGYPPGSPAPALAGTAGLPGGTRIEVGIDAPGEGAVLPPGAVSVSGTASVGTGEPVPNTAVVFVLDVSNSTSGGAGVDCTDDGLTDRVLDCEVAAARRLNQVAAQAGSVGAVGAAAFGQVAGTADAVPGEGGGLITGPGTDADGAGGADMDQVLASTFTNAEPLPGDDPAAPSVGGFGGFTRVAVNDDGTNFAAGIQAAVTVANAAAGRPNRIVAFMSDGLDNAGDPVTADFVRAQVPADVRIFTFAVGSQSECGDPAATNSLALIAAVTGGSCQKVISPDLGQLPGKLTEVIASHLTGLAVAVDGGPPAPVTDVAPPLPQPGPVTVSYRTTVEGLASGRHRICVTATGTDGGGQGSVTDCRTVLIDVPPTVDPGGPYAGRQGTPVPIAGRVSDPDGDTVTTRWAVTPGPAVNPDATCSFGDPAALATTVTCTAPGSYALTLTGSDGATEPVTAGTTLTLTNAPPVVSAGGPYTGTAGVPVALTGTLTDPDSPRPVVSWTVQPAQVQPPPVQSPPGAAGPCSFTDPTALATLVTCPAPGAYTLTLTVADADNPPVTATTTLTLSPATVPAGSLSLTVTAKPATGYVGGDPVTVTYTVRNDGAVPMPAVRLTVTVPAALAPALAGPATVTPAPPAAAPCRPGSPCDLGSLQPGQQATVRLRMLAGGPLDASVPATVTTSGPDTDAADNTATARVLVRQPVLTVDPSAGPTGLVTRATGTGFPAGATIQLTWSAGISQLPGLAVVGRDGTFEAQALVFPHDQTGIRQLLATPVRGPRFGPVRSNDFLAEHRSLQPPLLPS